MARAGNGRESTSGASLAVLVGVSSINLSKTRVSQILPGELRWQAKGSHRYSAVAVARGRPDESIAPAPARPRVILTLLLRPCFHRPQHLLSVCCARYNTVPPSRYPKNRKLFDTQFEGHLFGPSSLKSAAGGGAAMVDTVDGKRTVVDIHASRVACHSARMRQY